MTRRLIIKKKKNHKKYPNTRILRTLKTEVIELFVKCVFLANILRLPYLPLFPKSNKKKNKITFFLTIFAMNISSSGSQNHAKFF